MAFGILTVVLRYRYCIGIELWYMFEVLGKRDLTQFRFSPYRQHHLLGVARCGFFCGIIIHLIIAILLLIRLVILLCAVVILRLLILFLDLALFLLRS